MQGFWSDACMLHNYNAGDSDDMKIVNNQQSENSTARKTLLIKITGLGHLPDKDCDPDIPNVYFKPQFLYLTGECLSRCFKTTILLRPCSLSLYQRC